MQNCDLILNTKYLLPIAPQNIVLRDHGLAISDGQILQIAPWEDLADKYRATEVRNFEHHILLPGLVNAHGHAAMTLLRGAGEDQSLQDWLQNTIWPLEAKHMGAEAVTLGTELATAEMLLSGTTTFSDMYFFPEAVSKVVVEQGLRAQIAFPVIEMANAWSTNVVEGLHKGLSLHDQYRHHEQIKIAFGPHAAYTVSEESLTKVGTYANEIETGIQIHLHENATEVAQARKNKGKSWILVLHELGLLSPQLQAVHMTQLTTQEIRLIADSGAKVVHCPSSNLKLASGYCPVAQLQEAGVEVALGTDGAASNNRLDMFKEAHVASLLAKHENQDPTAGQAENLLYMATLGGAKALGMQDQIGSLEIGKAADLIAVDTNHLGLLPLYDPFAALIHGNCGDAVSDVFVNGEALVENYQPTRFDKANLIDRAQLWYNTHISS